MTPFEKLLLRRARNSDLQRSTQWLANISYAVVGGSITSDMPVELAETMEFYGQYAETEDPDCLGHAEAELGRILRRAPFGTMTDEDSIVG